MYIHIGTYTNTCSQVYGQIRTHTAAAAERHIFRITKRDVEEKVKEQREKRDRDEKNLDVSEGEFNITKEQR